MNLWGEEHKFLCNYVIYIIIEIHLYLCIIFLLIWEVHEFRFSLLYKFGNNFGSLIIVYCYFYNNSLTSYFYTSSWISLIILNKKIKQILNKSRISKIK